MPQSLDTVSRIIVRAEEQGLTELTRKHKDLTAEAQASAAALEQGGKAAERADRGLEGLRKKLDPVHRDLRELERVQRAANAAMSQGLLGQGQDALDRHNKLLDMAIARTGEAKNKEAERAKAIAEAAEKEAEAVRAEERRLASVENVNKSLTDQIARLRLSGNEYEKYAALQRAGTTASTPEGRAIVGRVDFIQQEKAAQQAAAEATKAAAAAQEQQAAAAQKQQAAIDAVNAALFDEQARLTLTSEQYKLYNALKQAGVSAGSAEGQQIAQRVAAIEAEKNARIANTTALRDAVKAAEAEAAAEAKMAAEAREILQQINPAVEAQKRLQQQLERNKQLFAANLFGKGTEGAENFAKANAHAEDQARKVTKGVVLSADALRNLSYQINDVISGFAMGQSPFTIATQQGGQFVQVLQGPRGIVEGLKDAGKWLLSLITPAVAVGGAMAAAAYLAIKAWNDWDNSQKEVIRTLTGLGRSLGVTKDQFNAMAEAAGKAGDLSVSSAREMLNTLGRTGQIVNPQDLVRAVSLAKDYAATFTNGDIDAAMKEQADLIRSGAAGIRDQMNLRGLINDSNRHAIEQAVNLNDTAKAYGIFLDSLNGRLVKHAEVTGEIAKAWESIKKSFQDMMNTAAPFLERAAKAVAGFLEMSARGFKNVTQGDFSQNPISRALGSTALGGGGGARISGPTVAPPAEPIAYPEAETARRMKEIADGSNEAAKATDKLKAALEAKAKATRESMENDKASVAPIQDAGKAEADLQLKLNDRASALSKMLSAFKPGDSVEEMKKVQSQWTLVTDAIKSNDEAQKRKALSDSESTVTQGDVRRALEERTAAEQRQRLVQEQEIKTGRDAAESYSDQDKKLRELIDRKTAISKIPPEKRTAGEAEDLEKITHEIESQRDAMGRRITDEEKSAAAIRTSEKAIKDRTTTQRVDTAVEQKRQELMGKGITGRQAENELEAAGRRVRLEATDAMQRQSEEMDRQQKKIDLEKELLFASNAERARRTAELDKENELLRTNGEVNDAVSQGLIKQAGRFAEATAKLQDYTQLWGGVGDAASSAFTTILQGLAKGEKAGDTFRKAIGSLGDSLLGLGSKNLFKGAEAGINSLFQGGGISGAITAAGAGGFNPASIAVAGAGALLSFFGQSQAEKKAKKQKAAQDYLDKLQKEQEDAIAKQADELAKQVDLQKRLNDYADRLLQAQLHGSDSLAARLQLFDAQAQRDRAEEAEKGNGAIVQLEAALAAERLNIVNDFNKEVLARSRGYQDRLFQATNDNEKLAGQLAAFDRAAQKERADEWERGGGAINDLEAALQAERLKIVRDYNKQVLDEQKSFWADLRKTIQKFIDDMRGGQSSPLSPLDRLAAAQGAFQTQFSMAGRGDRDALEGITGYATTLLDAARDAYASGAQFQNIYKYVLAALQSIQRMSGGGTVATVAPVATTTTPVGPAANTNIPPAPVMAAPATTSDLMNEVRLLRSEVAAFRVETREGVARDTNVVHADLETLTDEVRSGSDRQARETRVAALRPKTGTNG
jgi:hypothetical protein